MNSIRYTITCFCSVLVFVSCQKPATELKSSYDFSHIKAVAVEEVKDYPFSPESGMNVTDALIKNLKKIGLKVIEPGNPGSQSYDALLMCSIHEYKEKRSVFIPVELIDAGDAAGYSESAYALADSSSKTSSTSPKTAAYQNPVTRVKEIQFTDAVVGLTLQLVAASDQSILWSANYSYTALNQADALSKCTEGAIRPLAKILKR